MTHSRCPPEHPDDNRVRALAAQIAALPEVDTPRKRIALTLRLDDEAGPRPDRSEKAAPRDTGARAPRTGSGGKPQPRRDESGGGALAEALRRAGFSEKRQ